jgi:hypothetical protein
MVHQSKLTDDDLMIIAVVKSSESDEMFAINLKRISIQLSRSLFWSSFIDDSKPLNCHDSK